MIYNNLAIFMFCLFVVCLQTVCSLFTSSFRIQILGLGRWTCRRRHRQCWKPLRFRSKPEKKFEMLKRIGKTFLHKVPRHDNFILSVCLFLLCPYFIQTDTLYVCLFFYCLSEFQFFLFVLFTLRLSSLGLPS